MKHSICFSLQVPFPIHPPEKQLLCGCTQPLPHQRPACPVPFSLLLSPASPVPFLCTSPLGQLGRVCSSFGPWPKGVVHGLRRPSLLKCQVSVKTRGVSEVLLGGCLHQLAEDLRGFLHRCWGLPLSGFPTGVLLCT